MTGQSSLRILCAHALPACALALMLTGCGTAAPRFRTQEEDRAHHPVRTDEDETRFVARIAEETAREDDRKVDIGSLKAGITRLPDSAALAALTPAGIDRDSVLLAIVDYLGVPYHHGGITRQGIDCSGFTMQVYASSLHVALPHSTAEQFDAGRAVERDSLQFGDLVFFNTTGRVPSHVGVFIEDNLFAHASVTEGVTISSLESTYFRNRFVGAKRVAPPPPGLRSDQPQE